MAVIYKFSPSSGQEDLVFSTWEEAKKAHKRITAETKALYEEWASGKRADVPGGIIISDDVFLGRFLNPACLPGPIERIEV